MTGRDRLTGPGIDPGTTPRAGPHGDRPVDVRRRDSDAERIPTLAERRDERPGIRAGDRVARTAERLAAQPLHRERHRLRPDPGSPEPGELDPDERRPPDGRGRDDLRRRGIEEPGGSRPNGHRAGDVRRRHAEPERVAHVVAEDAVRPLRRARDLHARLAGPVAAQPLRRILDRHRPEPRARPALQLRADVHRPTAHDDRERRIRRRHRRDERRGTRAGGCRPVDVGRADLQTKRRPDVRDVRRVRPGGRTGDLEARLAGGVAPEPLGGGRDRRRAAPETRLAGDRPPDDREVGGGRQQRRSEVCRRREERPDRRRARHGRPVRVPGGDGYADRRVVVVVPREVRRRRRARDRDAHFARGIAPLPLVPSRRNWEGGVRIPAAASRRVPTSAAPTIAGGSTLTGGLPATEAVVDERATADPARFEAVTASRSVAPKSAGTGVYAAWLRPRSRQSRPRRACSAPSLYL